jgi:4-hydroxy-tetrahydrodipicolinate synthase
MKIQGLYTALVTPVLENKINCEAFGKLLEHVLKGGSEGLVVLGGTGEYCALSMEQKIAAVKCCLEKNAGRVPVVVGILNPGLYEAIEMGNQSKKLGADAVMLVTPYYVIPDQQGLVDYHLRFMDAVDLPLILYNIPHRTLVNMQPETVAEIVDKSDGQVVGIKECTPNFGQVSRLVSSVSEKVSVICGEENLLFPETIMGSTAAILATSNLIPRFWKKLITSVRKGDIDKAVQMHLEIQPFIKSIFAETNPGPLKTSLRHAGFDCGTALPPLHEPSKALSTEIIEQTQRISNWWK